MLAVALGLFASAPMAMADEAQPTTSRHTFRAIDSGDANRLAQPRPQSEYRVVKALPLQGDAKPAAVTAPAPRLSSTASASTSDLAGGAFIAAAPTRAAMAPVAVTLPVAIARQSTPLVVAAASDAQPVIDDRAAVDNNARLARGYQSYAPTTVSYEQAQAALAAENVSAYAPAYEYAYPVRTYYRPAYVSYSYAPSYCAPTYCAPTYYRPAYYGGYYSSGYCAPRYYTSSYYGGYYGGGYCAPRYYTSAYYGGYYGGGYCAPSFGFSYGHGSRHGSSWGISLRW
jgi:hypothetical protein